MYAVNLPHQAPTRSGRLPEPATTQAFLELVGLGGCLWPLVAGRIREFVPVASSEVVQNGGTARACEGKGQLMYVPVLLLGDGHSP